MIEDVRLGRSDLRPVLIPPLETKQVANQASHLGGLLGRGVGVALVGTSTMRKPAPRSGGSPRISWRSRSFDAVSLPS